MLTGAAGRVLEVGVGTGKNLPYYPAETEVTAIDFSPTMLERAGKKIEREGLFDVVLREMNVQRLDFPDDSFDTIVSTCVFCSVPLPGSPGSMRRISGVNITKRIVARP